MKVSSKGSTMREIMEVYGGYRLKGKRPEYPKKSAMDKYVGKFMIYEMPDFDNDYLIMDGDSYVEIKENGTGEFHFGLVTGHFNGKIKVKKMMKQAVQDIVFQMKIGQGLKEKFRLFMKMIIIFMRVRRSKF